MTPEQALQKLAELIKHAPEFGTVELTLTFHAHELREIESVIREKTRGGGNGRG